MTDVSIDEAAWEAAAARHDEALSLAGEGRLDAARDVAEEALAALRDVLGDEHPDVANALDTVAGILVAQGRSSEALPLWRRSLAAFDAWRHEDVAREMRLPVAQHFAAALVHANRFDEACAQIDACITEAASIHGEEHAEVAAGYNLRGMLLKFTARYDAAEVAYARALALYGGEASAPAGLLHNLAGLACSRGDFARAEAMARAALAMRDDDALGTAADLAGLGDALAGLGRTDDAIARYREALATMREHAPDGHPEVACYLQNLADALADAGRTAEAESCYREAIARKERCYGATHPEVAAGLASLAGLLADDGRHDEARSLATRAVEVASALEAEHPLRVGCEAAARRLAGAS